ncbi:DUF305 domain-containing protein [Chryseobacterium sp. SC28]|uniref:DUF305 domain-containing protein n=1 Tax=Chryseobacterium sp. SC28 TaxID=2268028 RepID=UPI000F651A78|nr:DUF305 domain-containing protein [Chryseobacterium sp. SC28]RRQ46278.1 DUF305 domain-containing protein [Chryseobacterium sp. SC28]
MENMNDNMSYGKLFSTLLISFVIMYFVMFLNMDEVGHYHTSITRVYMSVLMVAPMAILMILMMRKMYPNNKLNTAIILSGIVLFVLAFLGLRTQTPVGDIQYMKAMIPHHSSAIMTSKNASIKDPEVRKLADSIIKSQEDEIRQMESMIKRLE